MNSPGQIQSAPLFSFSLLSSPNATRRREPNSRIIRFLDPPWGEGLIHSAPDHDPSYDGNRMRLPPDSIWLVVAVLLDICTKLPSFGAADPDGCGVPPATSLHFFAVLVTSNLRVKLSRAHLYIVFLMNQPISIFYEHSLFLNNSCTFRVST